MTRSLAFLFAVSSSLVVGCGGGDSGGGPGGSGGFGAGGSAGFGGAAGDAGSAGSSASGGSGGALGGSGGNGGNPQLELLDALGTSVWSALVMREGKQRAIELQFDASSLLWAEIRNPYGPARRRRLRIMQVEADGKTVNTTLNVPTSWPVEPENGKKEEYELVLQPGTPRTLLVTSGGVTETFTEGAWPAPETGLTAIVRVFANGGTMAGAFCETNNFTSPNRPVIWEFARGKSSELPLATEIVAGVPLDSWIDPTNLNQFAVTNVPGMDTLGGTLLSDQFNFIVTYLGRIAHGGGSLSLREEDDEVADAIWAFLGPNVGSASTSNVFLEVHNHVPADLTPDEPSAVFATGDVQAEFMVLRCDTPHEDIDIQINQGSGFVSMGQAATKPQIDSTLFPPAL